MELLYLMSYGTPEKAASNYLGQNRNEAFVSMGWNIHLYVPVPCRGLTEDERLRYRSKAFRVEKKMNGHLTVHRFWMYAEGKSPVLRALRYLFISLNHVLNGCFAKGARECNVLFSNSTPPLQGVACAVVKTIRHIPFVYNLQDIFPDSLVNNGLAKKGGVLWKIGRKIENFTYRHADKIIVISEDFKKNIMAKGVPEEKIEVIYNWVDQDAVVDIPRHENKLFDKYNLDRSKFYVTYNGNIGLSQNMDMLLEVAQSLKLNPDIQFVLVGDGAYLADVDRIIAEKDLSNVHLLPFQPYEDISHVFSLGDVSIVISKPGTGAASVPSKTWSIMSASRPILANFDENEIKSIIEDNGCGIFTKAGDKEAFTDAIFRLYNDKKLCREYGKNGRQFVMNNLTKEVGTQKYVEVVNKVVKGTDN